MSISKKLMIIVILTIFGVSITIWGVFQLTKGGRFHQLNIRHQKYNAEITRLVLENDFQALNLDEIVRLTKLIRQQPIDCLEEINLLDTFMMKLIGTYNAIELCKSDIRVANTLLESVQRYKNNGINQKELIASLNKAQQSFDSDSKLFEPLVTDTVSFVFNTVVLLIIIISSTNVIFITYLSKSISSSINQVTQVFNAITDKKTGIKFPENSNAEIKQLIVAAAKFQQVQEQLSDVSHMAGKAEVASSVLHNVGNVLNGPNVAANLLSEKLAGSNIIQLKRASVLVEEHLGDFSSFVAQHPQGKHLGQLIVTMASHLDQERIEMIALLDKISKGVEHIKEIVSTQQDYAYSDGIKEEYSLSKLIDDALDMHVASFSRLHIKIEKSFQNTPKVLVDKHRLLQILINLFSNGIQAIESNHRDEGVLSLTLDKLNELFLRIRVADNGLGIPAENLTKIFNFGFTTKKDGHGFGLHSSALAAKELGGELTAESAGENKGAVFTITIPIAGYPA